MFLSDSLKLAREGHFRSAGLLRIQDLRIYLCEIPRADHVEPL